MEEADYIQDITDKISQGKLDLAFATVTEAIQEFKQNGQLHFLKAAISAQQENYELAIAEYQLAIQFQPDLAIARFQLGLLQATLGDVNNATLALDTLATQNSGYLSFFANGIIKILNNEIEIAQEQIQQGIAANRENVTLNNDMKAMLGRLDQEPVAGDKTEPQQNEDDVNQEVEESDQTHLLDIYQHRH